MTRQLPMRYKRAESGDKKYFHGLLDIDVYLHLNQVANANGTTLARAMNEIVRAHAKAKEQ